jgi:molecular chaperone GrpE
VYYYSVLFVVLFDFSVGGRNGSYVFECVSFQEVQGKAPGTIVVVSKIGYKLHDRVIRPALVGVAKGP